MIDKSIPCTNNAVQKALAINNFCDKFLIVLFFGTVHCQGKRNSVTRSSTKTVGTFSTYLKAQTVSQCNIRLVFPDKERCPKQVLPQWHWTRVTTFTIT